ncbi:MAG TPA: oxidoreductase, partial [Mycobacterium sp.]|nr:oxidoreductase [Mycobacterium sp.]
MSQPLWSSRPTDLYGRRKRDRLATALWGVGVLVGGVTAASWWKPSKGTPVCRTVTAVGTDRDMLTPDGVAL